MTRDAGSVWWADLLLGTVCLGAAAVFGMASTTVGPFAEYTLVYGRAFGLAYLGVSVGVGVQFLRAGIRKLPEPNRADAGSNAGTADHPVVTGNDGDADPQ